VTDRGHPARHGEGWRQLGCAGRARARACRPGACRATAARPRARPAAAPRSPGGAAPPYRRAAACSTAASARVAGPRQRPAAAPRRCPAAASPAGCSAAPACLTPHIGLSATRVSGCALGLCARVVRSTGNMLSSTNAPERPAMHFSSFAVCQLPQATAGYPASAGTSHRAPRRTGEERPRQAQHRHGLAHGQRAVQPGVVAAAPARQPLGPGRDRRAQRATRGAAARVLARTRRTSHALSGAAQRCCSAPQSAPGDGAAATG